MTGFNHHGLGFMGILANRTPKVMPNPCDNEEEPAWKSGLEALCVKDVEA